MPVAAERQNFCLKKEVVVVVRIEELQQPQHGFGVGHEMIPDYCYGRFYIGASFIAIHPNFIHRYKRKGIAEVCCLSVSLRTGPRTGVAIRVFTMRSIVSAPGADSVLRTREKRIAASLRSPQ